MKVSIVIPTRSRADTLTKTLRTAVEQSHDNVEIIVSNNGGDPATRQVVEKVSDRRVRCIEPDRRLSMSHNFEFAMSHATGDWLVLIGDDDGILPNGISRGLEILAESGAEALASPTCLYRWPVGKRGPFLTIPYGVGWEWRSSRGALRRMLSRDMGFNDAPTTYTGGIVSAALYSRIKEVKGTFYQSQIPDCYSAFAFCSATESYVLSRESLMIAGISAHSHGRASLSVQPTNFHDDESIPFHSKLPLPDIGSFTSSFQAMLYESYLQTSYLRTDPPITSLEEQIVAILAYSKWYKDRVPGADKAWDIAFDWTAKAAERHHLDVNEIRRKAERLPIRARLSQHLQILRDFTKRYVVDETLQLPISDVYEASRVAAATLKNRPSRLGSYSRTVARRLLSRGTARLHHLVG